MTLQALIFDVDGTLADTEETHRQAFNMAFLEHGLGWEWNRSRYADLLRVTGGKERMRRFIAGLDLPRAERSRLDQIVPRVHATKTRIFSDLVDTGEAALRPGIARLISEARDAGLALAVASTTSQENVRALVAAGLGSGALSWFSVLACGDAVAFKKPAPDIYRLALSCLGKPAASCVAFEDSMLGVHAATAAGLFTVATPTAWTCEQDLSAADLVLPSLGDPQDPVDLGSGAGLSGARWLGLAELTALHQAVRRSGARRSGASAP